jgi:hypothetical protein
LWRRDEGSDGAHLTHSTDTIVLLTYQIVFSVFLNENEVLSSKQSMDVVVGGPFYDEKDTKYYSELI